jgi:hypothetical protein
MITYILDGQIANPANREDIRYRIDYTNRRRISEFEITVENLIFVREDKERIFQHLSNLGRYQGMPLDIVFTNGQTLSYYIDFTDASMTWTENEVNVKIKRYRANENFFDNADSLSWRLVNFAPSDFTEIKYFIIPEQQPLYFISLSLAFFSLTQELARAVENLQQGIADLAAVLPPLPGNAGLVIAAAIRLAARIAYTIFIIAALIQIITQIIEMILPKLRTFKDIPYKRLIEKGCQYLGYQLSSGALNQLSRLSFLGTPERALDGGIFREIFMPNSFAYTDGFPTEMDSIPTLGHAIKAIEELYNLRTTVNNGVVQIERYDFYNQPAPTPIPLAYNLQDTHEMQRKFNDEYWKRKLLVWTKDSRDVWTYDDKKGHICEVDTSCVTIPDPNLNLLKGFERIDNPFALGSRKSEFTFVERFLKNILAPAVDLFTGGALTQLINNRVGVLVVSSQYYTVNKLLWKAGDKIHPNHREVLSAKNIIQTWHNTESVEENTNEVIENIPVRMNEDTFLLLSSQNVVNLSDGTQAELLSLEWSEHEAEASATIEIESNYNVNLNETIINGGGF